MEQKRTRKFSLEDDFMNLTVDDLIFGYIQHSATYVPEKNLLYITADKVSKEKKMMAWIIDKSPRTVQRKIDTCVEKGLLIKREVELNNKPTWVYEIPQETIGRYEIVQDDLMWYIICTRRQYCFKLYVYLLNKYKWKKQEGKEMYSFTCGELAKAIGYAASSADKGTVTSIINMGLQSLKNEGIIDYEEYYDTINGVGTPKKRLTFVASKMSELPNGASEVDI